MGVEGAEGHGVLIDGEKVRGVFLADDFAEGFFLRRVDVGVRVCADVVAGFFEQGFCFCKGDPDCVVAFGEEEGACVGVSGFFDDVDEVLAVRARLQGAEDVDEEFFAEGEDFVVMVPDGHFEVEAGEFGEMAFCV